jgi:hypothetical protein
LDAQLNRSISVAVLVSVGLHGLLLVALSGLVLEGSASSHLPVLTFTTRATPDAGPDEREQEPEQARGETPEPSATPSEEQHAANPVPPVEAPLEAEPETRSPAALEPPVPVTEPTPAPPPQLAEAPPPAPAVEPPAEEPVAPEPTETPPRIEPVITTAESNRLITIPETVNPPPEPEPTPERVAMTEREVEMLSDRLDEWAERFYRMKETDRQTSWEENGRVYSATLVEDPGEDPTDFDYVTVEIRTEVDGQEYRAEMRMKRLAFSHYAQFVDRWDPRVQIHDDVINGRFHSNSEIYVGRTANVQPVFRGRVTTAYRGINTSNSQRRVRREEVFLGGLETGVRRIALARRYIPFADDARREDEQVMRLEDDASIRFLPDGTAVWRYLRSPEETNVVELTDAPSYWLGEDKAVLHVEGTLNGRALVYAGKGILVTDDLIYAEDPRIHPESDDLLGLVSNGSIEIAEPDVTGPGDLSIHAAIYAGGRFNVRRSRQRADATLHILGSLSSGSLSATEPRFATSIEFDDRLAELKPPRFPQTDRYEAEDWDGKWEALLP